LPLTLQAFKKIEPSSLSDYKLVPVANRIQKRFVIIINIIINNAEIRVTQPRITLQRHFTVL